MPDKERELISDKEIAVGLAELHVEELIRFRGDDEVDLTRKGIDYAWTIFHNHSPKEMVALYLVLHKIIEVVDREE